MGHPSWKIRGRRSRRSGGLAGRSRPSFDALEGRALLATGLSFVEPTSLPLAVTSFGETLGVAKGDFNGDGKLDLAVTYTPFVGNGDYPGHVAILAGNGDGTFRAAVDLQVPTPATPGTFTKLYGILARDFNKDGKLDLIVAEPDQQALLSYQGKGDGTFAPATILPAGIKADSIQTADLNGDGKLDLVGLDESVGSVSVLMGRGDGTFSAPTVYAHVGVTVRDLAIGDVDGKKGLDLIVPSHDDKRVNVLLNDGTGHFGPIVSTPTLTNVLTVTAADFLGNGTTQVVIGSSDGPSGSPVLYTSTLALLTPVGDGTFVVPTSLSSYSVEDNYPAHYFSENVAPDLNGDGRPDLLFGHENNGGNFVTIGLNRGGGVFDLSHYVASPGPGPDVATTADASKDTIDPGTVLAGDFHGTGIPDIVVGWLSDTRGPGGLAILPGVPQAPGTYRAPRSYSGVKDYGYTAQDYSNFWNPTTGGQLLGPFGAGGVPAVATLDAYSGLELSNVNPDGTLGPAYLSGTDGTGTA